MHEKTEYEERKKFEDNFNASYLNNITLNAIKKHFGLDKIKELTEVLLVQIQIKIQERVLAGQCTLAIPKPSILNYMPYEKLEIPEEMALTVFKLEMRKRGFQVTWNDMFVHCDPKLYIFYIDW